MPVDDFDDLFPEDDESDAAPAGAKGKNPVAEQRKQIKALEARLKEVEPEYERLKTFESDVKTTQRDTEIKTVFGELELPEPAVKFFKLENPEGEVTKEAVARWAVENQFASAEQFSGTQATDKGFVPTTHGEAFVPGAKVYTRKEYMALLSDMGDSGKVNEANKAIAEGRVNLNDYS